MCSMSMVMDWKGDEWNKRYFQQPFTVPTVPYVIPGTLPPPPTQQEIDEFRNLLERAREYDRRNNEPDCELEEKKKRLRDMADQLGLKIEFV